jgi:hypothetical protein
MTRMKVFRITTLEQEQWERVYIVEASSEKSALKKFYKDPDSFELIDGEMYNLETDIDEIEEVKCQN